MKKAASKKPAAKPAGTDRPTSGKATTTSTTKTTTKPTTAKATSKTTTKNTETTKTTTAVPSTPKPPATPKTPKPPATPKTVPATPKTPKPPTTPKTPKPATSRPSTAKPTTTASKPAAAAAKRPATATAAKPAATKPATAGATRPATAKATSSTSAAAKTTKPATAKPTTAASGKTTTKVSASRPATASAGANGVVSPRENGDLSSRPSTTAPGPSSARPATGLTKSTSGSKSARPATGSAAPGAKKATTPRASTAKSPRDAAATGLPSKSPRDIQKSPRHNVAGLSRTTTAPELTQDQARPTVSAGSRTVSVGGNLTRAAPAGRRKPTVNPLKNRKDTPIRDQPASREGGRAAAHFLNGMGLLAAVGGAEGQEFGQVQLRKVSEDKPKPLLIRVKGRRNVTARVVETTVKSLNKGDAFVLIDPSTRTVFEWRGSGANKMEIAKAMDISGRVKNKEFGGRADIFVLEDGKTDQNPKFWELVGGKGNIAPAEQAGDDEEEDKLVRPDYLFGVVEKTEGKPELQQIAKHKFNKEMLQSGQVYLLDCLTELYMWVGKGCANSHRTLISAKAQEALAAVKGRPKWVTITRVIEGAEPEIFKEKFCDWPSTLPITMAAVAKGNIAAKVAVKFDVASMFVVPKREDRNIDDGSGKVEIWRVKDHAKEPIDPNMYGQFFDTESYVILYKYMIKNREVYIIYFWQGKKSSINEKGSSALLTVDLDDSIGGNATQLRVVQNKEPKHFMKLFKGIMIVHKACTPLTEDGASTVHETALYQIRGCNNVEGVGCDVRAVQLATINIKCLNTNDVFLLNTPEKQFIWLGTNSCKFLVISQENLVKLGNAIKGSREQVFINEGEEPSEFWEYLGEGDYYKTAWKWYPRLFHCSAASGSFKVEEVLEWDQEDLDPGHMNILDTSGDIFLWTGHHAINIEEEKKMSMQSALDYARLHPTRLSLQLSVPDNILSVAALREPYAFRAVFHGWDDSKAKSNGEREGEVVKVEDLLKDLSRNYSLGELRSSPKMLNSHKLESYLSSEDFFAVFKMDKDSFSTQPLWKQEQQKKTVGLY